MTTVETIDDNLLGEVSTNKIELHSRLSIALVFILLSPYYASYLYGVNLYRAGKQELIFGSITTLVICNLAVLVGLLGFDLTLNLGPTEFYFHFVISRSITSFLVLIPIWNKHFNNISAKSSFNYKTIGILLSIKTCLVLISFNSLTHLLDFRSTFLIQPPFVGLVLIGKNILDLINRKPFKSRY
jgi:hypothetical protein